MDCSHWKHRVALIFAAISTLVVSTAFADEKPGVYPFAFRDVGKELGLLPDADRIRGHGAAWGDIDGDGWIDLYIGTFEGSGSRANMLFRNAKGKFQLDSQKPLEIASRSTGMVFADLDSDGDLDLYVASMPMPKNNLVGCSLYRNDGAGKFTNISAGNGACPEAFGGRGVAALDYDGDELEYAPAPFTRERLRMKFAVLPHLDPG